MFMNDSIPMFSGLCSSAQPALATALVSLANNDLLTALSAFAKVPYSDMRSLGIGIAYFRSGNRDQAIDVFAESSAAIYLGLRGQHLLAQRKPEDALPYLEVSTQVAPTLHNWLQLAEAYANMKDLPAERRALDKAIALEPTDFDLRRRKLMLEYKASTDLSAVNTGLTDLLAEIEAAQPTNFVQKYNTYWALAEVALAMREPNSAIEWLSLAVAVPTVQDDFALGKKCRIYLQLDDFARAWHCQESMNTSVTNPSLPYEIAAEIYAREKNWTAATQALIASMVYDKQPFAWKYVRLAQYATTSGDMSQAQQYWQKVSELEPTHPDIPEWAIRP